MHKIFAQNNIGRDFVIGDLHGQFTTLGIALKHVDFDASRDRLFCCGDLIDRGPENLACLALLDEPWFFSCRGNHEDMAIGALRRDDISWFMNGGQWALEAMQRVVASHHLEPIDEELVARIKQLETLPLMMTIDLRAGRRIRIVHAELPFFDLSDAELDDPVLVEKLLTARYANDGLHVLWGRELFRQFYQADLSNVEKIARTLEHRKMPSDEGREVVISGHTIVQRPLQLMNFLNIDTGAFYQHKAKWAGLTLIDLNAWEFYHARTDTGVKQISPLVVNTETINNLRK